MTEEGVRNSRKEPKIGTRHLQAILLFTNMVVIYISRLNVSVSLVAMTNAAKSNPNFPEYLWTEEQKSFILSSFYWGYILTQIPGGYLVRRFGVKKNLFASTFGTAIFTSIIPFSVSWGKWEIFCLIRIGQGLLQGVIFPCIQQHLANWSPPQERTRLGVFAYTGFECGTVLATGLSGIIAEGPLGWPGISYISALLCFVWCALWVFFAANNAESSKFISNSEKEYIEKSLLSFKGKMGEKPRIRIPWKAIFNSKPFYALLMMRSAQSWSLFTIQAEFPAYMNGVLKFNIKSNALYSSLPYLASWIFSYIFMIILDILNARGVLGLTSLRKTINSIATFLPAFGLFAIGFFEEYQKVLVIALMTLIVGVNSGTIVGSSLGTTDLAPNHTGITVAVVNMVSNMVLMLAPLFVGVVVVDEQNRFQWQIVYSVAGLILCCGGLIFLIWGSAEEQEWNSLDYLQEEDEERLTSKILRDSPLKRKLKMLLNG